MNYLDIYWNTTLGSLRYTWDSIALTNGFWGTFFWYLLGISALFFLLEVAKPWRTKQPTFRKDFWLDFFYMFFQFFIFGTLFFYGLSEVVATGFNELLSGFGINNLVTFHLESWPGWAQLITLFLVADFISWSTHILLHRVPFLWRFHKVHHSVEQMGFAAHLRYHWMENIVYKSIQYLPLGMIGFGIDDFFIVHMTTLAIGHWNHANFTVPLGPLKYVINNPEMHIWHHAHDLPEGRKYGVNFGISLSIWDYLFRTAWIPKNGKDIRLGFPEMERFPKSFWGQVVYGFGKAQQRK